MKELTIAFNALLQDKRVRSEQSKYESIQRQRSTVINKYKRAYQEFLDLVSGLQSAKNWYAEMKEEVESLGKNVESFVNNRRSEGAQLLNQIEQSQSASKSAQAELEQERLRGLMDRMSMEPAQSPPATNSGRPTPALLFQPGQGPRYGQSFQSQGQNQYQMPTSPPPNQSSMPQGYQTYGNPQTQQYNAQPQQANAYGQPAYNPSQYGRNPGPTSPPPNQTTFGMNAMRGPASPPPNQQVFGQSHQQAHHQSHQSFSGGYPNSGQPQHQQPQGGHVPLGYVPPPPPPGPPPLGPQQTMHYGQGQQQQQGYGHDPYAAQQQRSSQPPQTHDPWAGLNAWK